MIGVGCPCRTVNMSCRTVSLVMGWLLRRSPAVARASGLDGGFVRGARNAACAAWYLLEKVSNRARSQQHVVTASDRTGARRPVRPACPIGGAGTRGGLTSVGG